MKDEIISFELHPTGCRMLDCLKPRSDKEVRAVWRKQNSKTAFWIYACFKLCEYDHGGYPTVEQLAEIFSRTQRTIRRALHNLESRGVIAPDTESATGYRLVKQYR